MPAPYLVVANDPQIVKHILKDEFNKYSKADTTLDPFFYYFEDFLGEGIFVVKHGLGSKDGGQEWSRMRKVSAQIFTRKNFNSMMQEVFMSKAESLRRSAAPGPCSRCPPQTCAAQTGRDLVGGRIRIPAVVDGSRRLSVFQNNQPGRNLSDDRFFAAQGDFCKMRGVERRLTSKGVSSTSPLTAS